jgi:DNA-binding transcriptional MerR regulator
MAATRSITIGQLANYAGVTIKTVRHYHRVGLLEEPPRDASGYRRYTAEHAIRLIKIRTLAEAGVPLARIKELLAADPEPFAAAISDIDRSLQKRSREIAQARERLRRLTGGDRLFVSSEVADYLDRLRDAGVSERGVQMEREMWILLQSVSPRDAAAVLAERRVIMNDPEFRAIYRSYDAAYDWSPDDPRLARLAARARRWMAQQGRKQKDGSARAVEPAFAQLVATSTSQMSPAWQRLAEITRGAS